MFSNDKDDLFKYEKRLFLNEKDRHWWDESAIKDEFNEQWSRSFKLVADNFLGECAYLLELGKSPEQILPKFLEGLSYRLNFAEAALDDVKAPVGAVNTLSVVRAMKAAKKATDDQSVHIFEMLRDIKDASMVVKNAVYQQLMSDKYDLEVQLIEAAQALLSYSPKDQALVEDFEKQRDLLLEEFVQRCVWSGHVPEGFFYRFFQEQRTPPLHVSDPVMFKRERVGLLLHFLERKKSALISHRDAHKGFSETDSETYEKVMAEAEAEAE